MFQTSIIIRSHGSRPAEWNIWVEFESARDSVLRVYSKNCSTFDSLKCTRGHPDVSSFKRARYSEDVDAKLVDKESL